MVWKMPSRHRCDTCVRMSFPNKRSRSGPVGFQRQFSAFRYRNYRLYFIGMIISFTGSWIQMVAQSWLVYQLTHSAYILGVASAFSAVGGVFFCLPAGYVADHMPKRRLIIITQILSMLLAFALGLLTRWRIVTVTDIVIIGFLNGVVTAFDWPIRQSFSMRSSVGGSGQCACPKLRLLQRRASRGPGDSRTHNFQVWTRRGFYL